MYIPHSYWLPRVLSEVFRAVFWTVWLACKGNINSEQVLKHWCCIPKWSLFIHCCDFFSDFFSFSGSPPSFTDNSGVLTVLFPPTYKTNNFRCFCVVIVTQGESSYACSEGLTWVLGDKALFFPRESPNRLQTPAVETVSRPIEINNNNKDSLTSPFVLAALTCEGLLKLMLYFSWKERHCFLCMDWEKYMGYSGRVTKCYSCVCNLHTADYFYPLCCKTKENSRW